MAYPTSNIGSKKTYSGRDFEDWGDIIEDSKEAPEKESPKKPNPKYVPSFSQPYTTPKLDPQPKKIIFNNPATIVFWNDGSKTVVKAMDGDNFDPERGYLQAYFEKTSGLTRTKCNKMLRGLVNQYNLSILVEEE
jgi:hypothetical protein